MKAVNSPLRQSYSPEPEPTIVFFRNQIPVLYDGESINCVCDKVVDVVIVFSNVSRFFLFGLNFFSLSNRFNFVVFVTNRAVLLAILCIIILLI